MTRRRIAAVVALLGSAAAVGVGATSVVARTGAARTSDHGTAYASINRVANGLEYGSANTTDSVLGASGITFKATITAGTGGKLKLTIKQLVLYGTTGSLTGTGSANVTISGSSEKFSNGVLKLTTGAGSQKGHSLAATFTGNGDASKNEFTLNYTGTYK